ncbi:MAG: hypothetical protein ABR880_18390 [Candidatus Sulfotelmatobacter sp.]|jgi:hypothetical protein
MAERIYLTVAEVVAIHHHQIEEYGGEHGLLNQGALESPFSDLRRATTTT